MRGFQLRGRACTPSGRIARAGLGLLALSTAAVAGTVTAPFNVRVDLTTTQTCTAGPESSEPTATTLIQCRSKPIGPVEPASKPRSDGQAFRFHIPSATGESRFGAVDLYAGAGTITSWRIVHVADWDYVEMTIGW